MQTLAHEQQTLKKANEDWREPFLIHKRNPYG
jgi:hypothetical protein